MNRSLAAFSFFLSILQRRHPASLLPLSKMLSVGVVYIFFCKSSKQRAAPRVLRGFLFLKIGIVKLKCPLCLLRASSIFWLFFFFSSLIRKITFIDFQMLNQFCVPEVSLTCLLYMIEFC